MAPSRLSGDVCMEKEDPRNCVDGRGASKPLRHLNLKGSMSKLSFLKSVRPNGHLHSSSTEACAASRGQRNTFPSSACDGLLIRILFRHFPLGRTRGQKKSVSGHASRKRIPLSNSGGRYFFGVTRECPDISAGCFSPIKLSRVGATSARMPLTRFTWSLSSAT